MYLEVSGVKKSYGEGGSYVQVLKGINTDVIIWDLYSSSITLFQTSL